MTDVETYVEEEPTKIEVPQEQQRPMGVSEAARLMRSMRNKQAEAAPPPPEAAPEQSEAEAEAPAEDAAPPTEEAPGETQEEQTEPEAPTIDPPRSWSKAEKERFASLPPETQSYIVERETERDREVRRTQNETAEKLKGLTAKEQAVEQARAQYETALPQLLQTMQAAQMGEFSDVRTIADVEKMAAEDWPRYLKWDVGQKKLAAVQQEMQAAQQRQHEEKSARFAEFAKKEDEAFAQAAPETQDAKKFEKLQQGAVKLLKDIGFSDNELGEGWSGQRDVNIRDHRIQLLVRDAYLYREARRAAKETPANKKPVPPVQRPGAARPAGQAQLNRIKSLEDQLVSAKGNASLRIATELMQARRALQQ